MASQGKFWVFTLNNPVAPLELAHPRLTFWVYQGEIGEEGTPHYQGYCEFAVNVRLPLLQEFIPGAHWEKRRGTAAEAYAYCTKEDTRAEDPVQWGVMSRPSQGRRTDLEAVQAAVAAGATMDAVFEQFPSEFAAYPRFVEYAIGKRTRDNVVKVEMPSPRPWQAALLTELAGPVDERKVFWVVDTTGGKGKTYLAKHLVDCHGAFYCNGGKHADIVYAYQAERIVIFDYVRDAEQYVQYGVIEQLKNGCCFNSKYTSGMKRFEQPHVVVFSNFHPDQSKLSADRWDIRVL